MAWTYVTVFAGAALQVVCETSVTQVPLLSSGPCCGDSLLGNGTCRSSAHCGPGCYPRVSDNDTARCVPCDSELPGQDNVTSCNYTDAPGKENMTTLATAMPKIGGPGVAASLLLGTLLISLFLILSVASFFYLKRSNRLPALFYRRKNALIFQPSETAVMISTPASSGKSISIMFALRAAFVDRSV
uniref:Si:ch211-157b11.12 n=1 Tax=Scleropages formosus TaxID=113540 RepID=A0A8C9VCB8_SCLFO